MTDYLAQFNVLVHNGSTFISARKSAVHEMFFSHVDAIDVVINNEIAGSIDPYPSEIRYRKKVQANTVELIARSSDGSSRSIGDWHE